MKFACPLFVAVVLYRIVAADLGAEHLWLLNFLPLAALALCGPKVFPRRVALLLPPSISVDIGHRAQCAFWCSVCSRRNAAALRGAGIDRHAWTAAER